MPCPTTPLSCLDPVNIFAGLYNPNCGGFADPTNFQAERALFQSQFDEQINNYGVDVDYFVYGFSLSEANLLYGEHTTAEYSDPFIIKGYPELEESFSLSRYGYDSQDELVIYFSINTFNEKAAVLSAFYSSNGQRIEPKSDDLIKLTALGCNRPGDRGSKIFRVTEAKDQSVSDGINPAMGSYIWRVVAKRYETSHETNSPQESGNDQVYDNAFAGKEISVTFPSISTPAKVYDFDIDQVSETEIFDMSKNDTSVYGDYY
jgi:hypothetical protein